MPHKLLQLVSVLDRFLFKHRAGVHCGAESLKQGGELFGESMLENRDRDAIQRQRHEWHFPTQSCAQRAVYYINPMSSSAYDAAYQGTRGSNSEDASIDLLSPAAKLLPRTTLEDVFNSVARGEARYGVVPVENTLAGSIHRCYDLLFEHDVKIIGETVRHILFALIAPPGVPLSQVRKALSHPVALAQCEKFFRDHPQIQPVPVYDTAGAVEIVMNERSEDSAAV